MTVRIAHIIGFELSALGKHISEMTTNLLHLGEMQHFVGDGPVRPASIFATVRSQPLHLGEMRLFIY